jgi:DNA-binding MltR family transcriptional regulator
MENDKEILTYESDRGSVIVGAALLEASLEDFLAFIFSRNGLTKKQIEGMFDSNGPAATFSAKISLCRGFGLISALVYADLNRIRKLRNRFAHSREEVNFLADEISRLVYEMDCTKPFQKRFEEMGYGIPKSSSSINDGDSRDHGAPPDWKIHSMGLLKHAKAVFCLGVKNLEMQILAEFHAAKGLKNPP